MIQAQTTLKIADNSGAKLIQCIKVLGGTRRRYAQLGDIIVGAIKVAEPRKTVKKHDVVRAVVVRQRKEYRRSDGSYIRFDDNAAVIIDAQNNPEGNRILGPIARELREKGFDKIITLAQDIL